MTPPGSPAANRGVTTKDAGGNAGTSNITFTGIIDGVVNPTLIDMDTAWAVLLFSGGAIYRNG